MLLHRIVQYSGRCFNLLTPKIWLLILPSSCYTFPCNYLWEVDVRSRKELLPDKFEHSHYQFAGLCMDVLGRSNMLIMSGSLRVNWLRKDLVTVVTYCIMSFVTPNLLCWPISDLKCHQCSKDYSGIKCNIICLFFPLKHICSSVAL